MGPRARQLARDSQPISPECGRNLRAHAGGPGSFFNLEDFMDHQEVLSRVKEDNVQFISLQFTDVTGAVKSLDIPINRLNVALKEGIWFDGSSVEGFARIQERDMRLVPDSATCALLPWSPGALRRAR